MNKKDQLLKEALSLSSIEKNQLIDELLKSLNEPNENMDLLWKAEAENRINGYNEGDVKSVSLHEAIKKYNE